MPLDQFGFRHRNDDGSETTATFKAAQNSQVSLAVDVRERLRIGIDVSTDPAPTTSKYRLAYKEAAESVWTEVKASGGGKILLSASPNVTASGEATTAQLTPPTGKTTSNFNPGRMWDDESGLDDVAIANGSYTELEFSIIASSANGALASDVYSFRVERLPGAAGRSQIAADNFNRASLGANWKQQNTVDGAITIYGSARANGANAHVASNRMIAVWDGAGSFANDQYSAYILGGLSFLSNQYGVGAAVRSNGLTDGSRSYYEVVVYADSSGPNYQTDVNKMVNGTVTNLVSSTTPTWANGDEVSLEVVGTTLTVKKNGVALGGVYTLTDSSLASGKPGLSGSGGDTVYADSWEGGSIL